MSRVICDKVSQSEREGLQDGSETCCDVWSVDCTLTKVSGAKVFFRSEQDGQD